MGGRSLPAEPGAKNADGGQDVAPAHRDPWGPSDAVSTIRAGVSCEGMGSVLL